MFDKVKEVIMSLLFPTKLSVQSIGAKMKKQNDKHKEDLSELVSQKNYEMSVHREVLAKSREDLNAACEERSQAQEIYLALAE